METVKAHLLVNGQIKIVKVSVYDKQIIRSTVWEGFEDRFPCEYVADYVQRVLSRKFTVLLVEATWRVTI